MRLTTKVVEKITDKDKSVREALAILFRTVLDQVEHHLLLPFFPLLMAHTRSAMTMIDAGVRLDSLKFLDMWLEALAAPLVSGMHRERC
jgi:hypothetical protein